MFVGRLLQLGIAIARISVFADEGDRSVTYGVGAAEGKPRIGRLVVETR